MRLLHYISIALLLGCAAEPIAPGAEDLVGRWRSQPESLSPGGSMDRLFVVGRDGHAEDQVTSRGVYPGQLPDQVSAQVVLFGRIGVSNRSVRRDFTGWPLDSVRYAVRGDELHLEFYTYPADAPELTRQVLYQSQ
jgi:hypothetical protein